MLLAVRSTTFLVLICAVNFATESRVKTARDAESIATVEYTPNGLQVVSDKFAMTGNHLGFHIRPSSGDPELLDVEADHDERLVIATSYRADVVVRVVSGPRLVLRGDGHGHILVRVEPRSR